MAGEIAIKVDSVSKTFKLPHEKTSSVKGLFLNLFHGKRTYERQQVLNNVSFEIEKGEFFGIVGRNGSGKSTMLKLLAGIYSPDTGGIAVNGKLTPFIELGVGFNPELTGRENVYLNGALLGFNRKEMDVMYDEIVEFAELGKFMDQKLKNYSSGMQVRLAFAIAIRADTEVLILDEVLAVGDAAFQQKCNDYFEKIKKTNKTVVLVTHDMGAVTRYCSRALLLEDGDVKLIGSPEKVSTQYTLDNMHAQTDLVADESLSEEVKSLDIKMSSKSELNSGDNLILDISYELKEPVPVYLGLSILYDNISVFEHNSRKQELDHTVGTKHKVRYTLPVKLFATQQFKVNVSIFSEESTKLLGYKVGVASFFVHAAEDPTRGGLIQADATWVKR